MGKLLRYATTEEKREIAEIISARVANGETIKQIASDVGEHFTVLYKLLEQVGVKLPPRSERPTVKRTRPQIERDETIARRYLSSRTITMKALAEEYGMSKQHVDTVIKRYLRDQQGLPGSERLGRTRIQRSLAVGNTAPES